MIRIDRRTSRLISLAVAVAALALLLGCSPESPQSTFDARGPVAQSQLTLFYIIFWAGLFVFIAVEAVLIYSIFRFRARRGQGDPEQIHGSTRLEIAWTIAPAVVLAVVAVPTISTLFYNANSPVPPEQGGLIIEATGHQWWFEFNYPDAGVVTANEMHIPVGEPVNIMLRASDVIHSYWVPKLAGKVDMIPRKDNTIWLQANEPGVYYGQCAEFCGIAHAHMRFRVVAESREEFETWLAHNAQPAFEPVDPLAELGRQVFESNEAGCFACHTIEGVRRARGRLGPDLTHMASRRILAGGVLDNTDETGQIDSSILQRNLRAWITDPERIKPGNKMARLAPVYQGGEAALTEEQISALVAYLVTLK